MIELKTTTLESESVVRYNMGYIWVISLVAAMGGLLFGYDWVVIGEQNRSTNRSSG